MCHFSYATFRGVDPRRINASFLLNFLEVTLLQEKVNPFYSFINLFISSGIMDFHNFSLG